MAKYKGTVFFEWGTAGWTENWYMESPTRDAALSTMKSYVTQRRKSLTNYASVKRVRVTNPDPPRDALVYTYLGNTGQGGFSATNDEIGAEVTNAAVNVRFFSAAGKWRNMLARGLPQDAVHSFFGSGTIGEKWADAFRNTIKFVIDNSLLYRTWTVGNNGQFITSIRVNNGYVVSFTTENPMNPAPLAGATLRVSNCLGISPVNGMYVLDFIGAAGNEYFVKSHQRQAFGALSNGTGRIVQLTADYPALVEASFIGGTSRKTGRPSTQPRGRASVRRA